ncbi:unnamed protein product [Euphydryas editha]|uniref:Mutator-like transposase domain-containing protein n=1 Tax=Euphydryas editha TaxID=104508 RepID=A0AAU9TMX9_EUPED|nr:unnamed protein product [Euphydryas editha]
MCNVTFTIENDTYEDNYLNLNACAVAAINLPSLTENTFVCMVVHNHKVIGKHWEKVAVMNMEEAAKQEKELAIAHGKVTKEGYGEIDVIVDGCWSKRSYKKNYSALSGAAAILGKNTGKIIYLGIKNKYCQICAAAQRAETEPKEHLSFKNYSGPSTTM